MTSRRPFSILVFLRHAGYLRHYGPVIRILAARGHRVHLALSQIEKDPGDARLAEELAREVPSLTYGLAPERSPQDGWRSIAFAVRGFLDLARYVHPRYAGAGKLRRRVARNLDRHFQSSPLLGPLASRLCTALVRALHRRSGTRLSGLLVRALTLLEQGIPPSRAIDRFIREHAPDAVLVSPVIEIASNQVDHLKSARRLRVPSAVCVASWDNLTGKGLIRVVPDRVLVWNDVQRREAVELHGIPRERIVLTGAQRFDEWFERRPSTTREAFAAKVGLRPDRPYLLYVCSSLFVAPDEAGLVEEWIERVRAGHHDELREIGILVRPHPQNARQWRYADLSRFPNVAVWPGQGTQPDDGEARADFFDSIAHGAAVVGLNTSALIEAAILGKSVHTVLAPDFAGGQEQTLHFHYLRREHGGFLHVGRTMDEHLDLLAEAVRSTQEVEAQTRRFVEEFVRPHGLDRPAAPIVARAVEELAASEPLDSARPSAAALLVRALLYPLAVGASLRAAAAGRRARRADVGLELDVTDESNDALEDPEEVSWRTAVTRAPEAVALRARLERLAAMDAPLVLGPWTRDEEEELLYWIPFLRWAGARIGLDPARATAVSSGAKAAWYTDVAAAYVDAGTETVPEGEPLDPALLVALCEPLWRGETSLRSVLGRLSYVRIAAPPAPDAPAGPVAVDFRFSSRFPESAATRVFVEEGLAAPAGEARLAAADGRWDEVTSTIAGSRCFVGTWGATSTLALSLGVPTVAVYAEPEAAASAHADVAYRAAHRLDVPFALVDYRSAAALATITEAARLGGIGETVGETRDEA